MPPCALGEPTAQSEELSALASSAAAQAEALKTEAALAAASRDSVEAALLTLGEELQGVVEERCRLEAEVASLSLIAKSELEDAEAQRLAEVGNLLGEARAAEARLGEERATLARTRAEQADALAAAEASMASAEAAASKGRRELWQRLKRQAVVQAAAVRELQRSLSASQASQREAASSAASTQAVQRGALAERDNEVMRLRAAMRAAEAAHVKQLAASGVTALKHGRKGKPHARHVRCTGMRLEWGRADERGGRGYDKFLPLHEIESIHDGIATDVARRLGKGRDDLFLCVTSASRSLDLEFPSRAARDEWSRIVRRWREVSLRGAQALPLAISASAANAAADAASFGGMQAHAPPSATASPPRTPTSPDALSVGTLVHAASASPQPVEMVM